MDKIFKLKAPVDYENETVTELKIRPARGADLRAISVSSLAAGEVGAMMDLAGRLVGKPSAFIDLMLIEDVLALMDVVKDFLLLKLQVNEKPI
jgi:hypothetical protein